MFFPTHFLVRRKVRCPPKVPPNPISIHIYIYIRGRGTKKHGIDIRHKLVVKTINGYVHKVMTEIGTLKN